MACSQPPERGYEKLKIKVVLSRKSLNLFWVLSDPKKTWDNGELPLGLDEAIVELDEDVVSTVINQLDDDTFDEALRRFAHARLSERDDSQSE